MRRLFVFAAFLLIISAVPVCAQRSGRSSGGSHGGFGGHSGFVSHGSGGPGFGGSRVVPHNSPHTGWNGSRTVSHVGSGPRSFSHDSHFRGRRRIGGYGFRGRCFGCYGYPLYGYYDPYWWWDSSSSYDEDNARERELANEMNAENLDEQQRLREQDQDIYAPLRASHSREDERAESDPATVLVFQDQHQREIHNYAIVGQMLWNFTPQHTEKIPLSELDIPATTKANDDRGVEFHVPQSGEGQ